MKQLILALLLLTEVSFTANSQEIHLDQGIISAGYDQYLLVDLSGLLQFELNKKIQIPSNQYGSFIIENGTMTINSIAVRRRNGGQPLKYDNLNVIYYGEQKQDVTRCRIVLSNQKNVLRHLIEGASFSGINVSIFVFDGISTTIISTDKAALIAVQCDGKKDSKIDTLAKLKTALGKSFIVSVKDEEEIVLD